MRNELLAGGSEWTLTEFFGETSDYINQIGGVMIILMGLVSVIWGSFLLIQKLMSAPSSYQSSWAKITMLTIMGGALTVGGFLLSGTRTTEKKDPPAKEPNPSPTPESTPEPEPTQEPADPISLPKIENTETIFIVLGIILVSVLIGILIYRIIRSARKRAVERKEEEARYDKLRQKWGTFTKRAGAIKAKVYEAETDWDMLFNFPALADVSIPATAKLYKVLRDLDMIDQELPIDVTAETDLTTLAYPKTLLRLEAAWDAAFTHARRVGDSIIPAEEREKVQKIQTYLRTAMDNGSSENERQMAYDRAHKLIKQLRSIVIPEKAFLVLEKKNQLMIEGVKPVEPVLNSEEAEAQKWRQSMMHR